jgi:hypothetical protein
LFCVDDNLRIGYNKAQKGYTRQVTLYYTTSPPTRITDPAEIACQ